MEFTIEPVPKGTKRGRPALPNPFTDQFPTTKNDDGEDLAVTFRLDGNEETTEVKRLTRQARSAAKNKGLTAHVRTDYLPDENKTIFRAYTSEKTSVPVV